jgi:PadR family transcriptional regulator, regulatory protein PadR
VQRMLVWEAMVMPRQKDDADSVRLSAIEEDILTALLGRELYGLELLGLMNPGRPKELSFGSLYPALNRLEKKGFIRWRWGDEQDESGGARRKYYQVTGLGANTLSQAQQYRISLAQRILGWFALGGI